MITTDSTPDRMTFADKMQALKDSGIPLLFADRFDWSPGYSWENNGHWVMMESHPAYISYRNTDHSPRENSRVFADLSGIGRGDDYYDQSSTLERSNFRSLRRDHPNSFTDIQYQNIDVLGAYVGNLSPELISVLCNLATDYPLYDESDMSELESDEITESWDQYVQSDLTSEINKAHTDDGDHWDALTPDSQRDLFWSAVETTESYPEHDGHDIRWDYAPIVARLAGMLGTTVRDGE